MTTASTLPGKLAEFAVPPHRVLADFIHGCSEDPATRTMAATALVLTLWPLAGHRLTRRVPSMILLNAGETDKDPLDAVACHCTDLLGNSPPDERATAPSAPGKVDRTPELDSGNTRRYSRACHDKPGLVTDPTKRVILRLDDPPDYESLRRDVLRDWDRLLKLTGSGTGSPLSGSLTPDLWDNALTVGILNLGLPVFFLPHLARNPLVNGRHKGLFMLGIHLSAAKPRPITPALQLPPFEWFDQYMGFLRSRLHLMPAAFEFSVLQSIHELGEVCARIIVHSSVNLPEDEASALCWDLHVLSFRGIVMGIASLAWHCIGFNPGCPQSVALKVVRDIRDNGPVTRRDLLRGTLRGCKAADRDLILERLAAENLIRLDDKMVTALSVQEFVQALHARPELPEPHLNWPLMMEKQKA